MGMRRLAARFAAGAAGFGLAQMFAIQAMGQYLNQKPNPDIGQPIPGGIGLQAGAVRHGQMEHKEKAPRRR